MDEQQNTVSAVAQKPPKKPKKALVCGIAAAVLLLVAAVVLYFARYTGVESPEFALAVLTAGIVIFDALSVRYNAGLHAKELNKMRKIIDNLDDEISKLSGEEDDPDINELANQKDLKEFLGHTPCKM